jgi:hypothetical protein
MKMPIILSVLAITAILISPAIAKPGSYTIGQIHTMAEKRFPDDPVRTTKYEIALFRRTLQLGNKFDDPVMASAYLNSLVAELDRLECKP